MKAVFAGALGAAALSAAVTASPFPDPFDRNYADLHAIPHVEKRQGQGPVAPAPPADLPDANGLAYVVPGPIADGGKAWKGANRRARDLVDQMTLEEKVGIVTGQPGRCAGNTKAVPRLDLPTLCFQDGPAGVRPALGKTQFPAGVNGAATWDRDLIYQRSLAMGQEFYDLGIHTALAPVTGGPLGRAPREGRNWEGAYADPYATGVHAYLSVKGLQDSGVAATAKHFIGYEQETFRNLFGQTASYSKFPASAQLPISSVIDDKTTHELYAWPFAEAVRAGTAHFMSAYNRVNGTHASSNSELLNGLLKGEFGFQGSVMSDWGGVWSTQATIVAGNDLDFPGLNYGGSLGIFFDTELSALVDNGTVPVSRLDDAVTRVLTPYFALGQADKPLPSTVINALSVPTIETIYRNVQKQSTIDLIKKIGEDSAVLLKNTGGLPLQNPQRITIIGQDAGPNVLGFAACGAFGDACPIYNNNGTNALALGSGYSQPQNLITPLCAIQDRALRSRALVQQVLNNTAIEDIQAAATGADVALVFADAFAQEGQDREDLELNANGRAIIEATAAVNNNTIVILHIPGTTNIDFVKNNPNITAVLAPLLPGEQSGPSLVSVLWGDVSPSGKLPFTIGKSEDDFPPNTIVSTPVVDPVSNFTEKLLIDYRWFDAKDIEPTYEFGFGLSYSTFAYSNVNLKKQYKADDKAIQETNERYAGQVEGESLYDQIAVVSVDVKNTGDVTACEVAQLYIEFPASEDQPPKQLRGFSKLRQLKAGATGTAYFPLRRKDVMVWDTVLQEWRMPKDSYVNFHVGASSRKLPLKVSYKW